MFNNNLLMGAASASGDSLVEVGNSALFNRANSEYLDRTPSSSGSGTTFTFRTLFYVTGTLSMAVGNVMAIAWASAISGHVGSGFYFGNPGSTGEESLRFFFNSSGSDQWELTPTGTPLFRDNAWYDICWQIDTTEASINNCGTLEINGKNFPLSATVSGGSYVQNVDTNFNSSSFVQNIGRAFGNNGGSVGSYYDGYLAETVMIDGTNLSASNFGEYDSTGTFWTPKSSAEIKALTFGTNGYYLDNTTNAQTDASGNGNNFTNNNTVTLSTHTPTNLNALWNPLSTVGLTTRFPQLSVGNTTTGFSGSTSARAMLTLPVFYNTHLEFTVTQGSGSDTNYPFLQVFPYSTDDYSGDILVNQSAAGGSGGTGLASGASIPNWTTGDRVTLEIDTTNGRIYVFIDGSAVNSANPGAGSGFTFDFTMPASGQLAIVWINQTSAGKTVVVSNPAEFTDSVSTGYFGLTSTIVAAQTTRTKSNLEEYFDTTLYEGNGAIQRVGQFLPFTNSFTVANSALFNSANEEYFSRTFETPTDQDVWSLSWWMKTGNLGVNPRGIMGGATSNKDLMYVTSDDIVIAFSGSVKYQIDVDDSASFHHYYLTNNSGTLTFYIDGVSQGTASATQTDFNSAVAHTIGAYNGDANWFDGYMSQFVFVDGTVIALSAFGQVDTSTGRWICKDVTTTLDEASDFGNNGFFLNFANSSDMGNDVSGNNHDFTNNNTVVQVDDTPTVNFTTFDPNRASASATATIGNTRATVANSEAEIMLTTIPFDGTGKFYAEIHCVSGFNDGGGSGGMVGFADPKTIALSSSTRAYNQTNEAGMGYYYFDGKKYINGTNGAYGSTFTNSDVIGVYVNGNNIYFTKNNTLQNSASEAEVVAGTPTNAFYTDIGGYCLSILGAGGNNPVADIKVSSDDWTHTPFTGFGELSQDNLAEGESYQTAFSWIKNRDASDNHMLFDRVRGIYKNIHTNVAGDAEDTNVNTLQRFLNGGVQVGDDVQVNTASESYVAWNWYMETTGSGTSNTDGTINTTSTLVDTNLGLSISTYTGTGANATFGHGLGVIPEFFMIRHLEGSPSSGMPVYVHALGASTNLRIDNNNAKTSSATAATRWNNTAPTSSVISIGTSNIVNNSTKDYICYAFAPSQFISIGSYVGNGNANGTFVPTVNSLGIPIQPAWFLTKNTTEAESWNLQDTARHPYNEVDISLFPNSTATDTAGYDKDFVTGGFKMRTTNAGVNKSGITYVYLAFGTPLIDVDGRIITGR